MDSIEIPTRDGFSLSARLFPGLGRTVLLVSAAVAVPQRFYEKMARHFQGQGYSVLTFDYRGIGDSGPGRAGLRGFDATLSDWALEDQRAVLLWIRKQLNPEFLFLLGHSFGGQVAGLNSEVTRIDGMVTVCSQSGYWRLQGGNESWKVWFHVYWTFPLLCWVLGYLPWSWFAKGADLPKQAVLQWAAWCRHPEYLFGDSSLPVERYRSFAAPILAFSVDDDDWGTAKSVDKLMSRYPTVERRHLIPEQLGLQRIGHNGFFREESRQLWDLVFEWFEKLSGSESSDNAP